MLLHSGTVYMFNNSKISKRLNQPTQVGAYTLSGKSDTKNVIFILKHFFNEVVLLSQFFLQVSMHTLMVFLTKK